MTINVILPQMGESILEGTVTKWLKNVGDRVLRDEPLFEVSTDKVDTEIPSPADGTLASIVIPAGQIAQIGTIVAVIEEAGAATEAPSDLQLGAPEENPITQETQPEAPPPEPAAIVPISEPAAQAQPAVPEQANLQELSQPAAETPTETHAVVEPALPSEPQPIPAEETVLPAPAPLEKDELPEPVQQPAPAQALPFIRTSPLVRRIARETGIDLSEIKGTGLSGRITREDLSRHLERLGMVEVRSAPAPPPPEAHVEPASETAPVAAAPAGEVPEPIQTTSPGEPAAQAPIAPPQETEVAPATPIEIQRFHGDTETVAMTPMRKSIAEHMILSRRTSAHVQTVFEVDMTAIVQLRQKQKDEFETRSGIKLTYTPFFVKALVDTLRDFPILNSSVSGDAIVFKKPVNVGIAVALETGLIVPVIKDAQLKSFTGLALAIHDVAERARTKRLKPEEVQEGTITVTNPGSLGSLFGTPIINQPQVAILGIGSLEKRPIIINDAIAIRTMVYLVLSFDHRVIDGAVADQFMAALKARLQTWTQWIE